MKYLRKHKIVWEVITIVATVALVATAIIPYLL